MSYGFEFVFLLRQVMLLAIVGSVILGTVAAWNLLRAKASGAKLMLFGLGMQCLYGVIFLFAILSPLLSSSSFRAPILTIRLYMTTVSYGLSMIGIVCFAIGLFLHAKNQRGLQARVDELERILSDVHSRER
jgi:hypothetical protein